MTLALLNFEHLLQIITLVGQVLHGQVVEDESNLVLLGLGRVDDLLARLGLARGEQRVDVGGVGDAEPPRGGGGRGRPGALVPARWMLRQE